MNKEKFLDAVELAKVMAETSQCLKKKVGAVLMYKNTGEIVGVGHGGAEVPCEKCVRKEYEWQQDGCWAIHAEPRAIFDCFKNLGYNTDLSDFIMLVTHGPCDQCLKYMHLFKIPVVIYDIEYHNDYTKWEGKIGVDTVKNLLEIFDIKEEFLR